MYWSKVKTILIIVFFCINVFLLSSMIITVNRSFVISDETINNTVSILERNNIKISPELIPNKIRDLRSLELVNALQDTDSIAKGVLGDEWDKRNDHNLIEYKSGSKILKFEGCQFSYINHNPSEDIGKFDLEWAKAHTDSFFKNLNLDSKSIVLKNNAKTEDGEFVLTYNQVYSKKVIFESEIVAVLSSKGLVSIKGYGLYPKGFSSEKYPGRHVTSILIDLIRNPSISDNSGKVVTIKELTYGYYMPSDKDILGVKALSAVPKWKVKTDIAGEFYYEAVMDSVNK